MSSNPVSDHDINGMPIRHLYVRYLMASYLYYVCDEASPWSDYEYDLACRRLHTEWESFDHPHKYLLRNPDSLLAGTGFDIINYPSIVRVCSWSWKEGEFNR